MFTNPGDRSGRKRPSDTGLTFNDTATIDITTTGTVITADVVAGSIGATQLTDTAVTPGSFGSATQVGTFTVDQDGRLTAASNTTIAITSAAITDFNEAAQDAVGGILTDTATIDFTYNDGANTITADVINNSITDAKLRQGVARSVIGVTGNATANVADIQGTTDQVLRVNGAGTALAFGSIDLSKVATVGTSILALANGGTNKAITASAGAIVYSDSDSFELSAVGSAAGQIFQSNTTSAPTWSTATYPSTAGTSGNIIFSDGTNFTSVTLLAAGVASRSEVSGLKHRIFGGL